MKFFTENKKLATNRDGKDGANQQFRFFSNFEAIPRRL